MNRYCKKFSSINVEIRLTELLYVTYTFQDNDGTVHIEHQKTNLYILSG